jgi:hypothetical protein
MHFRQIRRVPLYGCIVGVQIRFQQQDRGDTVGDVRHFADFVGGQRAAQQLMLAVAQPLLDHLVAADGVFPHAQWYVAPVRDFVQVYVHCLIAETGEFVGGDSAVNQSAPARHGDAALTRVAYQGKDRIDATVKSGDGLGDVLAPTWSLVAGHKLYEAQQENNEEEIQRWSYGQFSDRPLEALNVEHWSPNGKYITFLYRSTLYVVEVATRVQRELGRSAKNASLLWSADGQKLLVDGNDGRSYLVDVYDGNKRDIQLPVGVSQGTLEFSWAPNKPDLLLGKIRTYTRGAIAVVDVTETLEFASVRNIGNDDCGIWGGTWSPNGDELA